MCSAAHHHADGRSADALLRTAAQRWGSTTALVDASGGITFASLDQRVDALAAGLRARLPLRGTRVAVWLDKRVDTVALLFAAMRAGLLAVPVNPALRPAQVRATLLDCGAALLCTDSSRLQALTGDTPCAVISIDDDAALASLVDAGRGLPSAPAQRDSDELALLLYTSGSTGQPKGVMVSHANLLAGAQSVAQFQALSQDDRLLVALPLSFDAGFSQITSAWAAGACAVLLEHLFAADIQRAIDQYQITGITAVPPLYLQLLALAASSGSGASLRFFANTGGHLSAEQWQALQARWPRAQPIPMYGLTEAFRASWLPRAHLATSLGAIGIAIPNARLHVLRPDGSACAVGEYGELVQQGPLVTRGYWNDPARSAERFRPGPDGDAAVWSGDTVYADHAGILWFVGRRDEQIKTSGYRVSPTEVEAAAAACGVATCVALGVPDPRLGQAIVLVVERTTDDADSGRSFGPGPDGSGADDASRAAPDEPDPENTRLLAALRRKLSSWQVPQRIIYWPGVLPRNANGKFDRPAIRASLLTSEPTKTS